jgi:hypothetical protein
MTARTPFACPFPYPFPVCSGNGNEYGTGYEYGKRSGVTHG